MYRNAALVVANAVAIAALDAHAQQQIQPPSQARSQAILDESLKQAAQQATFDREAARQQGQSGINDDAARRDRDALTRQWDTQRNFDARQDTQAKTQAGVILAAPVLTDPIPAVSTQAKRVDTQDESDEADVPTSPPRS